MTFDGNISADLLIANFECATKARLLLANEPSSNPDLIPELNDLQAKLARAAAERFGGAKFIALHDLTTPSSRRRLFDSASTTISLSNLETTLSIAVKSPRTDDIIPVYFTPLLRPMKWHISVIWFAALVVLNRTGALPKVGFIVRCGGAKIDTVKLTRPDAHLKVIKEGLGSIQCPPEKTPNLNKHCDVCSFRASCREKAIAHDDLRLMPSLSDKERRKLNSRGVTTIKQLSYTYRPRRKRREHATPRPETTFIQSAKYDCRLRALAIQKKQIHVTTPEEICLDGSLIYFDVEGIPGDDSYYLIGMRYKTQNGWIEHSFWASNKGEEEYIWDLFLARLATIEKPALIHYGSYESTFIARMRERYPSTTGQYPQLDEALAATTNLLQYIYGKIYFPTFSNGLKDIAGYLGFSWSDPNMSGGVSEVVRHKWAITSSLIHKNALLSYNIEDCRAAEVVAEALKKIFARQPLSDDRPKAVDVDALKVPFSRTYGPFVGATTDFQSVNRAAYWDYQREKVYVRAAKRSLIKKKLKKKLSRNAPPRPDATICEEGRPPMTCSSCRQRRIWKAGRQQRTTIDIIFTKKGARRQIIRHQIQRYRCAECRQEFGEPRQKTRIGRSLRAYIIYLGMELRLSNAKIVDHLRQVYGLSMTSTTVHHIKSEIATQLEPIYQRILKSLKEGPIVQVDETKGVVYGGGHYVWVFASMDTAAFVYSPGRDAKVLKDTLGDYRGVLVSDFYGAYDAIECKQQKCLIHLMRDINEAMISSPFNGELAEIGSKFGVLLRSIVDTIDRRGLKARYLRRHKRDVDKFFSSVADQEFVSEAAKALKKRLMKNRDRLFVFLDHDDVPWNNNNAEHAVRAFARLRNSMTAITAKGTQEYAILLSIQQTLKYREMDFLKFLMLSSTDQSELL